MQELIYNLIDHILDVACSKGSSSEEFGSWKAVGPVKVDVSHGSFAVAWISIRWVPGWNKQLLTLCGQRGPCPLLPSLPVLAFYLHALFIATVRTKLEVRIKEAFHIVHAYSV
jgi:hypothetical protein